MNDLKNIKNASETEAPQVSVTAEAAAPVQAAPQKPVKKMNAGRAAAGCVLAVCAFAAFLFVAYCDLGAVDIILTPTEEGINLDALGLVLLWILALIGFGSQLVLGIPAAILLRPAKKPSALRFVRYATVVLLILSTLASVFYTVYILTLG